MKKILTLLAMFIGIVTMASARDAYAHDASALPEAAQSTIKNNFKGRVSVVKIEKDFGRVSEYDVVLTDGTEISFDRNGNWKDIEVSLNSNVPNSMVPKKIANFVSQNQPGTRIIGIEKDRKNYEVSLSNGVDMKFDKAGNFLKFD